MTGIRTTADLFTMNMDQLSLKTQGNVQEEDFSTGTFMDFLQLSSESTDDRSFDRRDERRATDDRRDIASSKESARKAANADARKSAAEAKKASQSSATKEESEEVSSIKDFKLLEADALIVDTGSLNFAALKNNQNKDNASIDLNFLPIDPLLTNEKDVDVSLNLMSNPALLLSERTTVEAPIVAISTLANSLPKIDSDEIDSSSLFVLNESDTPEHINISTDIKDNKAFTNALETMAEASAEDASYQELIDQFMAQQSESNPDERDDAGALKPTVQIQKPLITTHVERQKPIMVSDLNKLIHQESQGITAATSESLSATSLTDSADSTSMGSDHQGKGRDSSEHKEGTPFAANTTKGSDSAKTQKAQQTQQQFETQQRWEMMKNVVSEFKRQLSGGFREIRIPLRHERFGNLDVKFNFDRKGSVSAIFKTTSKDVISMLAESREAIEEVLKDADFTRENINVQFKYIGE